MRKVILFVTVVLTVAAFFCGNMMSAVTASPSSDKEKINVDFLKELSSFKGVEVEKKLREAEKALEEKRKKEQEGKDPEAELKKKIQDTLLKLKKGKISLRKIFSGTLFVGDSLLNGLEVYNILNSDRLITQVSARLEHLEENIKKITSANPEVLILHYGLNMLWDNETGTQWFIDDYSELVIKLKKALPDTRIIISSIFPVDEEIVTDELFTHIPRHNLALKKMCKEIGVEFLDSTALVEKSTDYYGSDGIHFDASFYSEMWLPYIIESKGVTG